MKFFVAALLSLVCSFYAFAETSVWKVSSGGKTLYLGGTVHFLRESDYPLPEAFEEAFNASGVIVFESPGGEDEVFGGRFQSFFEVSEEITALENGSEAVKKYNQLVTQRSRLGTWSFGVDQERIAARINALDRELEVLSGHEDVTRYVEAAIRFGALLITSEFTELADIFMNPGFASLDTVVSPETYETIQTLCEIHDFDINQITGLKPYHAASGLAAHIYSRFCNADGVDVYFEKKAAEYGKETGFLDEDDVLAVIAEAGEVYGEPFYEALFTGLDDREELEAEFDRMVAAWRGGYDDGESVEDLSRKERFPAYDEALLKNRNNAWLPLIESYVSSSSGAFVLVGAAHMYGSDGLLAQLGARGYVIEQM